MKRLHGVAIFSILPLLFFDAVPVDAFEIRARGLYWVPTLKADMRSDPAGLTVSF